MFSSEFWVGVMGVCAVLALANKLWGQNSAARAAIEVVALLIIALIGMIFVFVAVSNSLGIPLPE